MAKSDDEIISAYFSRLGAAAALAGHARRTKEERSQKARVAARARWDRVAKLKQEAVENERHNDTKETDAA